MLELRSERHVKKKNGKYVFSQKHIGVECDIYIQREEIRLTMAPSVEKNLPNFS